MYGMILGDMEFESIQHMIIYGELMELYLNDDDEDDDDDYDEEENEQHKRTWMPVPKREKKRA